MWRMAIIGVMTAALGAAVTTGPERATAAGGPLGHVHGAFTANIMGMASADGPVVQLGNATIRVNAFDRTLDPASCIGCPTLDTGTIVEAQDTPRGVVEATHEVTEVVISDGLAVVITSTGAIFRFHDGGSPGNEVVGPPNEVGLLTSRDWYENLFFSFRQHITGFLTTGNIHVDTLPE